MFFPHCILDSNTQGKASQPIVAGKFQVKSVIRRQRAADSKQLVLAKEVFADAGGNGFIDYIHATEMDLSSSSHPQGIKLTCQVLGGVLTARHLRPGKSV